MNDDSALHILSQLILPRLDGPPPAIDHNKNLELAPCRLDHFDQRLQQGFSVIRIFSEIAAPVRSIDDQMHRFRRVEKAQHPEQYALEGIESRTPVFGMSLVTAFTLLELVEFCV